MGLTVIPATATTAGGQQVFRATPILATDVIGVAGFGSPYVQAYAWSGGFGSKYANPASLPSTTAVGISFAPNGSAVAIGTETTAGTTRVWAYPWSSGFGTRYLGTTPSSTISSTAFSPDSQYVAASGGSTPYVWVFPWSVSGFGTRVSDPGTTPAGAGQHVTFRPQNDAVVVGHSVSPYATGYPWSSSGFGTKYSDPGSAPAGSGYAIAFTATGSDLAVAHATTPFVSVYPWSSGFGTKYAPPAVVPPNTGTGISFTRAGDAIVISSATTSPYVAAYQWSSSGFGTKYSNPGSAIAGSASASNGNKVTFTQDDSAVVIGHNGSPYISAYPWTYASGFGTKYSDPGTALTNVTYAVAARTMFT